MKALEYRLRLDNVSSDHDAGSVPERELEKSATTFSDAISLHGGGSVPVSALKVKEMFCRRDSVRQDGGSVPTIPDAVKAIEVVTTCVPSTPRASSGRLPPAVRDRNDLCRLRRTPVAEHSMPVHVQKSVPVQLGLSPGIVTVKPERNRRVCACCVVV